MTETCDIKSELLEECRFCGASLDGGEFFDIFSILLNTLGDSSKSMYEEFQNATGIAVTPKDSCARRSACGICFNRLKTAAMLRQKAKESYIKIISWQQAQKLIRTKVSKTRKKGNSLKASVTVKRCLLCLNCNNELTEICRKPVFKYKDTQASLLNIYELTIGLSVPTDADTTFLCKNCIKSLQQIFCLYLPVNQDKIVRKRVGKLFRCKYCSEAFSSLESCKLHLETHNNMRQNACKMCLKVFLTHEQLITHLEKHYTQDESKCSICLVKYEDFLSYQEHFPCETNDCESEAANGSPTIWNISQLEEFETKPYIHSFDVNDCRFCYQVLRDPSKLTQHLKHKHYKNFCHFCKQFFITNNRFFSHMDTHINANYYFCRICFKEFKNLSFYECHAKAVHTKNICDKCTFMSKREPAPKVYAEPRMHFCRICSQPFNTFKKFKSHMRALHNTDAFYKCEECDRTFKLQYFLIRHMRIKHNVTSQIEKDQSKISKKHLLVHRNDKRMICKICSEEFLKISTYWEHTDSEHPDNICKICSKVFTNLELLSKHLERHIKKRKNLCNICAKLFSSTKKYRRHRRRKHKLYWCHICNDGRIYIDREKFIKHMDIHINKKYYLCRLCLNEFDEIESYRAHVTCKHQKISCEFCSFVCKSPTIFRKHHKFHFDDYACNICSRGFDTKQGIKQHNRMQHNRMQRKASSFECNVKMDLKRHTILVHELKNSKN